MPSPAFLHRQMHEAMAAAKQNMTDKTLTGEDRMLHRLYQDEKRLKGIQSNQRKAEIKRELLPEYQGWIDGILAADTGRPDRIVVMCATWMIDAGQAERAMPLIAYIIRHGLTLPDEWGRTPAAFFVEEICNPALTAVKLDASAKPLPADLLLQLEEVSRDQDMPDQVRAKLCKLLGLTLRHGDDEARQQALDYLMQAMTLNDGAGVKKEIDTLRRELTRNAPSESEMKEQNPVAKK